MKRQSRAEINAEVEQYLSPAEIRQHLTPIAEDVFRFSRIPLLAIGCAVAVLIGGFAANNGRLIAIAIFAVAGLATLIAINVEIKGRQFRRTAVALIAKYKNEATP